MRIDTSKMVRSSKAFGCYFFNRMKGVKYGKVVLNDSKVRIVPTYELEKFLNIIDQYGFPRNGGIHDMPLEKANELMRLVRPIITADKKIIAGSSFSYSGMGDRIQLFDRTKRAQRLFVMAEAPNPTRDFWEYIKKSIFKFN